MSKAQKLYHCHLNSTFYVSLLNISGGMYSFTNRTLEKKKENSFKLVLKSIHKMGKLKAN